jgi:hypothetical protein
MTNNLNPAFWKYEGAQAKIVVYYPINEVKSCEAYCFSTEACLFGGFLARKNLANFLK